VNTSSTADANSQQTLTEEFAHRYPLDVVKTRVQLQTGKGVGADSYNGMFDCFRKIVRNEG